MKTGIALAMTVAILTIALGCTDDRGLGDGPVELIPPEPNVVRALVEVEEAPDTLRALGRDHDVLIGAALEASDIDADLAYRETVSREFSIVAVENSLKLGLVRREANTYNFTAADRIIDFALRNGQEVRGHTLVWHEEVPDWLEYAELSREEALVFLEEHIRTLVGRYKGRIQYWDVVNEAIDENGRLRDTIWLRLIGPEYIELAFQWAHEADPDAHLYYNDYNIEWFTAKSDAVHALLADLIERGVPVHGVGFQGHFALEWFPSPEDIAANMERFADLGIDIQFTEVDVRLEEPIDGDKLDEQADVYRELLSACVSQPACSAFVTWGVTDKFSWIPDFLDGFDAGLIYDRDYEPKPAYWALREVLTSRPTTRADLDD